MRSVNVMIKPVSGACNMRCRYCFYADELTHREGGLNKPMSPETLETLIRRAIRCSEESVHFVFQGGEPTLAGLEYFKNVIKFEHMYNTKGLTITNAIQSNGLVLPRELIGFLAENRFLIGISLDGTAATHDLLRRDAAGNGTYARILENIGHLEQARAEFNVLCVVNNAVARQAREVYAALRQYRYVQFIPCLDAFEGGAQDYSLTPDAYLEFLKATFDLYEADFYSGKFVSVRNFDNWIGILLGRPPENCSMCGRCSLNFMAESNGDIYPCDFYGTDDWLLGNITQASFQSMAGGETERRFIGESIPCPAECGACEWYPLCRNGCRRERDEAGLLRWCGVYREFFGCVFPRMQRLAAAMQTRIQSGQH